MPLPNDRRGPGDGRGRPRAQPIGKPQRVALLAVLPAWDICHLNANGRDQIHATFPASGRYCNSLRELGAYHYLLYLKFACSLLGQCCCFSALHGRRVQYDAIKPLWGGRIVTLAEGQGFQTGKLSQKREGGGVTKSNPFIAVIERRIFLQECIRRSMESAFSLPVLACSTLSEGEVGLEAASAAVVVVSWMEGGNEVNTSVLNALSELAPNVPVIVLAQTNDVDAALTAIRHGAKGYISCTLGFDVAVAAVRFVLAGGA
jgi:hypothetical protein